MQKSFFDSAFFSANRRRLAKNTKADLIVITAHAALQRSADTPLKFYQDANFWYLTGLDEPEAVLVIDQKKDEEYLILAQRHERRDLWDGVRNQEHIVGRSGIKQIYNSREGWQKLKERLQTAKTVHTIIPPPTFIKFYEFYANPARRNLLKKLQRLAPKAKLEDLRLAMRDLRIIKQPQELKAIQKAIDITFIGLRAVKKERPHLKYEYEAEAILSYEYRRHGADGHGFEPIVAAGAHAATVHYVGNNAPLKHDDALLLDTGALFESYSADISRTMLPEHGKNDRLYAVYGAVSRIHDFALTLIKPGIVHRAYEEQVAAAMGEELIKLGLSKKNDKKSVRKYFPHMTSHHLGLDLHDLAAYDEPWEPGMVLTVEPGIYIPEEGIGVRIEDDLVITNNGHRMLNPPGL